MAYMSEYDMAGFNPLKAIGRALGSTGRAIVGAVVPGGQAISQVLDSAARTPSKSSANAGSVAPSVNTATGATSASLVQSGTSDQTTKALLDTVAALVAKNNQPQIQPTYVPMNTGAPAAPAQQPLPNWVIPVAAGGIGLALVLSMMSKR